ncbi:MAG TPA: M23 family metallopeptidase [Thermodesulfobacteriota bacterium]|nr:M23 family metallopeptidase [Thermodesulfobacteriota bacterium]
MKIFPKRVKPGGVCFVRVSGAGSTAQIHGEFRGKKFPLQFTEKNAFEALVGIDLNTSPGKYSVRVDGLPGTKDGGKIVSVQVEKTDFPTESLSLPPSMVELNPETEARAERESKRFNELFRMSSEQRYWRGAFIRPVPGELSTPFGVRRIINGQPKNPHSGIDLRGEEGTPVLATNGGKVALTGDFFFPGNAVFLDHGAGVYSMYFHLSEIVAAEGDVVKKGSVVGKVGSTGRSSGPHLHFGVMIRGARVNPMSLINVTENAAK